MQATSAHLQIDEAQASAPIAPGAAAVTLALELPAGSARLQTWLPDETSGKSRGAFFIEARRVK